MKHKEVYVSVICHSYLHLSSLKLTVLLTLLKNSLFDKGLRNFNDLF